jgi:hypothetical protein
MALVIGEIKPGFVSDDRAHGTLIPVPPPSSGGAGWGPVWLSFGSDFGDVTLRVAIYNSVTGGWRITEQLAVPALGERVPVGLVPGDHKVSVGRVRTGADDPGTWPCGYMIEALLKA